MNPPDQPTPRTDAAWAKTFLDDDDQCRAGNAATDMRDACTTLERELAALAAEHQRVCEVERELRAEVKRMTHAFEYDHKCLYEVRDRCHLWKQRAEKAEAELATAKSILNSETNRAEKAEEDCRFIILDFINAKEVAERYRLLTLRQDAELATEREKVRVLRLACERLRDCDWVISLPDRMDAVREIAREALKKMEGEK